VKSGRLHREHAGVYSVGTPALTPHERALATVLAAAPSVLSDFAALALWGFVRHWPQTLELTITVGDRRPTGIIVHRRTLHPDDIRDHYGIPVTSPARTLLDCAPRLERLPRIVNDALRGLYLTHDQLNASLARHPLHPGTKLIRVVVDGPLTESEFEDAFVAFCRRFGLPIPVFGAPIGPYRADALFPAERVVIECDGWDFHRDRQSFEHDRNRDANLLDWGYVTIRLTWERLWLRPGEEANRIGRILERRRSDLAA
jgi:hypothetical protein